MTWSILALMITFAGVGGSGALLGVHLGRTHCRAHCSAGGDGAVLAQLRQQLATYQRENERLRMRVRTLEEHLSVVLGRGCIIAVDLRKPQG